MRLELALQLPEHRVSAVWQVMEHHACGAVTQHDELQESSCHIAIDGFVCFRALPA
jgi:hypothetical protein